MTKEQGKHNKQEGLSINTRLLQLITKILPSLVPPIGEELTKIVKEGDPNKLNKYATEKAEEIANEHDGLNVLPSEELANSLGIPTYRN